MYYVQNKKKIETNKRYTLLNIIGNDLLQYGKLPICLLICIIATSLMIVTTVHYARLLTIYRERLVSEHNLLDIEWRNLILEKHSLSSHSRIEKIAVKKLQLQYIDSLHENIIIQNIEKHDV